MDIDERLKQAEQRFNELEKQKSEIATEQLKLQGEYRLLQEMKEQEPKVKVKGEK